MVSVFQNILKWKWFEMPQKVFFWPSERVVCWFCRNHAHLPDYPLESGFSIWSVTSGNRKMLNQWSATVESCDKLPAVKLSGSLSTDFHHLLFLGICPLPPFAVATACDYSIWVRFAETFVTWTLQRLGENARRIPYKLQETVCCYCSRVFPNKRQK